MRWRAMFDDGAVDAKHCRYDARRAFTLRRADYRHCWRVYAMRYQNNRDHCALR